MPGLTRRSVNPSPAGTTEAKYSLRGESYAPSNTPGGVTALDSVVMVRLRDGRVTSLTEPKNEAASFHISARNFDRPGWVYVSYHPGDGRRFSDEVVAVKMDGSKGVERLAHTHSDAKGLYRAEPHAVPSRDGSRVVFASNWSRCSGAASGPKADVKAYVVEAVPALEHK